MRGHLSEACQHQTRRQYLILVECTKQEQEMSPLEASERITPIILTRKLNWCFLAFFSGFSATWQQERKIKFVSGALINLLLTELVLPWCNELACHKSRRETWKRSLRSWGDPKGFDGLWLMTAAALRHTKCLSRLLQCDRREEHAGTSGLSRLDKRLAKNKQSAVIYQLDLTRGRRNHQSTAGFFFPMVLLSEKEAPARYAAPRLRPRSDETQTELFGHSEKMGPWHWSHCGTRRWEPPAEPLLRRT